MVLAIVGTLAGLATSLLRPDPDRAAEAEAWRLARLAERLVQEAELTGQVLAVRWTPDGYEFLRRDETGAWSPLTGDDVYAPRRFEPPLRLADRGEARFAPDADIVPRQWRLRGESSEMQISLSPLGEARVIRQPSPGAAL